MIHWQHQEEGFCEGIFRSSFFRDDEGSDELGIGVKSPDLQECAEKCVEAFNNLTESAINEICKEIINCAQEGGMDEEFELPAPDHATDILNHCWFTTLYVNMSGREDEIAYVVEGEGEWGDVIGFAVKGDEVIYVGTEYLDYMEDGE
ncbi:MAG: hypothetical protein K2P59_12880 [Acetatifactor sp.]|nr:hypothetical protein [Acetatifactor sp.]